MENNNGDGDDNGAEGFVDRLLKIGAELPCDDTNEAFHQQFAGGGDKLVPPFYDEAKFIKGQRCFHRYIFAMFIGKLLGLVSILAVPSIRTVLQFTHRSSEPLTAYRRYLATLLHMNVWYDREFKPGSDVWRSLTEVRTKHNTTCKRLEGQCLRRITQCDMALTQFGFIGFVVARPQAVGIYDMTDDELEALVHVWKVIGHLMGIEERFNICRDSLVETRAICDKLITTVFKPIIVDEQPQNQEFVKMARALIEGMWCMQPMLDPTVYLLYLQQILVDQDQDQKAVLQQRKNETLTRREKALYWLVEWTIYSYQYFILRWYHNIVMYVSFWLMAHFPFLAFYKFGRANSYVTILNQDDDHK